MPNTTVRAAAEGMPEINRRRLLLGLAAASTAAAAVTVAPAHSAALADNPELVRLGGGLAAIAEEYRIAVAERKAIIKEWSRVWPVAPDEIISDRQYGSGPIERDITGTGIWRPGSKDRALVIVTCDDLEWELTRAKRILKGKSIDKRSVGGLPDRAAWENELDAIVAQYTAASKYEAEKARVLKASGYEAANERKHAAADALIGIINDIMAQPETTMAGVVIKAQALAQWGLVSDWQRYTIASADWGPALAASVLRLAGEA
ncbi:MAG: hypothetical protein EOR01_07795 [Mesorhizobium sp.]|uniref:hypothetical protein n=1 Tax=Mesorhizobium sp. TaxID=1871066 RepID=UPI000FE8F8D6|nr:hypothetical protein [Mesorhizobium sp.]RWP23780.1 MAG: hypothetical protein EOR01_07795 [Mesorhizobium sp.]